MPFLVRRVTWVSVAGLLTLGSVAGCSSAPSGSSEMDAAIASMEAKVPTRERASVRVCETLLDIQISTPEDALTYVTEGLKELDASSDPNGMKTALIQALVGIGDATVAGDAGAYQDAALNLANVCTDIVSGEYGK